MSSAIQRTCYDRVILPLLWGGSIVLSPFAEKIRAGLRGRRGLLARAVDYRRRIGARPVILFHCASAGELEALRPVVEQLDRRIADVALSFFSPSAKSALRDPQEFNFADFAPIDARRSVGEYFDALRPAVIAVTKHDVWPNFVWAAAERRIPLFLINGNFHPRSLKLLPGARGFHRSFYGHFTEIMTVAPDDAANARRIAGDAVPVTVAGDSRYDRVLNRTACEHALPPGIAAICETRTVLLAGSTHEDDEELLIPVLRRLSQCVPDLLTIIVPHDPSARAFRRVRDRTRRAGLQLQDSDAAGTDATPDVLLVNRSGMLADLYRLGRIAYVGGGFGKGVHSVLEPMANALPVLCGPQIAVSHEAREARRRGLLHVVTNRRDVEATASAWLTDDVALERLRTSARAFVEDNSGAAARIAARLHEALHVAITS